MAFNNAVRLQHMIEQAHDDTLAAVDIFRASNGRNPQTLELEGDIPARSKAAFAGFRFEEDKDGNLKIVTGL